MQWGGGGWGAGALQLKKDDNRFLFSRFRVFTIYGWFFKTESWILWLIFIRFQDSRKFQYQSHDHMKFWMYHLLSGLKKTARNSQNAIKESPPKASQTQKIVFCWLARGGAFPTPEPPLDPQGGLSGPLDPSPNFSPPSTLRSGSGPG